MTPENPYEPPAAECEQSPIDWRDTVSHALVWLHVGWLAAAAVIMVVLVPLSMFDDRVSVPMLRAASLCCFSSGLHGAANFAFSLWRPPR